MKKLAEEIKRRRNELRLTRNDLADAVKVSSQTLWKWEKNATSPDADELMRLAKALKCPVSALFGETKITKEILADPELVLDAVRSLRTSGYLTLEEVVTAALNHKAKEPAQR
jgi:transcriptional regulator with XRE-family HTH domain